MAAAVVAIVAARRVLRLRRVRHYKCSGPAAAYYTPLWKHIFYLAAFLPHCVRSLNLQSQPLPVRFDQQAVRWPKKGKSDFQASPLNVIDDIDLAKLPINRIAGTLTVG